jgi:DNA-binding GntR family transcriptional regulator
MNQETPIEILRPRMLYEALADAIREQIFKHELAPGDPLDEFRLAKHFVVSRTPIREALKVLASEGIVELQARRGCFVARLTWEDVLKLFDLLELLETFAVREAIKMRIPVSLEAGLHGPLAVASRNAYLPDLFDRLIAKLRLAFGSLFDLPEMQPSQNLRTELAQSISKENLDEALQLLSANNESRRLAGKKLFAMAEASLPLRKLTPALAESPAIEAPCPVGEI